MDRWPGCLTKARLTSTKDARGLFRRGPPLWDYLDAIAQRSVVVGRGSTYMFDILIFTLALAGFVAIAVFGGRFIAAEDARERVQDDPDDAIGWLPGIRDSALLAESARELRASL
jgi:hypothetical protein